MVAIRLSVLFILTLVHISQSYSNENTAQKMHQEVLAAISGLVSSKFYDTNKLPEFHQAFETIKSDALAQRAAVEPDFNNQVQNLLNVLNDGHTFRVDASMASYYELLEIFSYAIEENDKKRLFPPDGTVFYYGIGLVAEKIDNKYFVSKLYDGMPAAVSGLQVGDEILELHGASNLQEPVFQLETKVTRALIRQSATALPVVKEIPVIKIYPQKMFLSASLNSQKIIVVDGKKLGYMRLWAGTNPKLFKELKTRLTEAELAESDGFILDLRSRWGGADIHDANLFVGNLAPYRMVLRDGFKLHLPGRWNKPIVALIDQGTRSGLEIFAYNLKRNDIALIGAPTAGALTAATGYLLPDDSFMMMAIGYTLLDGKNLNHKGVVPDVAVDFSLPFQSGYDSIMQAAIIYLTNEIN